MLWVDLITLGSYVLLPQKNSELLVVAFAENTPGGGSVHALPMAKKILEEWHKINN